MVNKVLNYLIDLISLKDDDIILAAYPKTGSTWVRFLFCNIISLKEWDKDIVDFDRLNETMIAFGKGELNKKWKWDSIPRIVKTHKKYSRFLFRNRKVILVLRDPRDVMISRYHFEKAKKDNPFEGTLQKFIQDQNLGLKNFFEHYNSWKPQADIIIKYEDLKTEPVKTFAEVLHKLNVSVEDDIIQKAVKRSDIRTVRSIEENKGHSRREKKFKSNFRFTRDGSTRQWKNIFGKKEIEIYENMKEKFNFKLY